MLLVQQNDECLAHGLNSDLICTFDDKPGDPPRKPCSTGLILQGQSPVSWALSTGGADALRFPSRSTPHLGDCASSLPVSSSTHSY